MTQYAAGGYSNTVEGNKKGGVSRLCCFLMVECGVRGVCCLAFGTIRPQRVVGAAARAFDDQQVDVALGKFFAAVLAAQFGEWLSGRYAQG